MREAEPPILHAGLIAAWRGGRWRGVLVRGASGAGKSDLALRAMAAGWRLVADDRVQVWSSGGRLFGAAPATLHGLVEARGVGVIAGPALRFAPVVMVLDAAAPGELVERLPEPAWLAIEGVRLPRARLAVCEPSALVKLEHALDAALRPSGNL